MAVKVKADTDDTVYPFIRILTCSLIFMFLLVASALAQQTEGQGVIESNTIIGLEEGDGGEAFEAQDPLMRALFDRQQRLEEALFVLEDRINRVSELAQRTDQRIARGEDPLVSLEIEQLWVQIRSLEQQNALLRETLEAAGVQFPSGD